MNEPTGPGATFGGGALLRGRQNWFRLFPEGNLEFLLVTRILLVVILLALAAVQVAQRPMVLVVFYAVFAVDYVLVIWWVVQVAADLKMLRSTAASGPEASTARSRAGVLACVPAALLFLALAPWPAYAFANPLTAAAVTRVLTPALLVVYLLMILLAVGALRRVEPGPRVWTVLLFLPVVHWFALHRLAGGFHRSLRALRTPREEEPILALPLADMTWVLAVLPWLALALVRLLQSSETGRAAGRIASLVSSAAIPCGAVIFAVFSIAGVAAMEGVQRGLVAELKKREVPATA